MRISIESEAILKALDKNDISFQHSKMYMFHFSLQYKSSDRTFYTHTHTQTNTERGGNHPLIS